MKILLDQGTPLPIRYSIAGHEIRTVHEMDWTCLSDYELLHAAAEHGFDVFITPDVHLPEHHDIAGEKIAILVLTKRRWKLIRLVLGDLEEAIITAKPGAYTVLQIPDLKLSEHFDN